MRFFLVDRQVKHLRVVQEVVTANGQALPMIAQPVAPKRAPAKISTPRRSLGNIPMRCLQFGFSATGITELRNLNVV